MHTASLTLVLLACQSGAGALLSSIDTDWGTGADDNTPGDVFAGCDPEAVTGRRLE